MIKQLMTAGAAALVVCLVAMGTTAVAAAPSLSGTWNFTFTSDGGGRDAVIEITQDGTALKAKMGESNLIGKLDGQSFELSGQLYVADAGQSGLLKLSGELDGEKLRGKGAWETYPLDFTAVRAK